jgi:hypothetical protein
MRNSLIPPSNGRGITNMPKGHAIQARSNQCAHALVLEPYSPFPERLGLLQFEHRNL